MFKSKSFHPVVIILLLLGAWGTSNQAVDSAEPSGPATAPSAPTDDTWGSSGDVRFTTDSEPGVVFGPSTCDVAIVGNQVWDLRLGKAAGVYLKGGRPRRSAQVLSADGQWFASATESFGPEGAGINIWSIRTGDMVTEIPPSPQSHRIEFLGISLANKWLLTQSDRNGEIYLWDIATGKQVGSIDLPERGGPGYMALSDDGRYLAVILDSRLVIYSVAEKKEIIQMRDPSLPSRKLSAGNGLNTGDARVSQHGSRYGLEIHVFPKQRPLFLTRRQSTGRLIQLSGFPIGQLE